MTPQNSNAPVILTPGHVSLAQLRRIARTLPRSRQTLLFSATMPKLMEELASTVAELQERNRALHLEARTDALTGLRNARALQEVLPLASDKNTDLGK